MRRIEEGSLVQRPKTVHDTLHAKSKTWRQFREPDKMEIHKPPAEAPEDFKALEYFSGQRITVPRFDSNEPQ